MTLRRAGCIGTEMQGMRSKNRCNIHVCACVCFVCVCVYVCVCVCVCVHIYIEQVQVVAIDHTLEPPSFSIRVDGQVRDTEATISHKSSTQ